MYITPSRKCITVDGVLGKGGEGIVYEVTSHPGYVAKIYHLAHRTPDKERKLQAMIANPPQYEERHLSPPHIWITWPTETLCYQGMFAGYLMPRVNHGHDIFRVYNPQARAANNLNFDQRSLLRAARNVAIAIHTLHARGYVMGDVNQKNILATGNALITLVDADSFQVRDAGGRVYRCPVGVPEYTPRELQGIRLDSIDRAIHHDNFGLAVIIFQLLMQGFHPFTGAPKKPALSLAGEVYLHCIMHGIFPYQMNNEFNPPPNAPPFDDLHPEMQNLFLRCFVNGHEQPSSRPTAMEWVEALRRAEGETNSKIKALSPPMKAMPVRPPWHDNTPTLETILWNFGEALFRALRFYPHLISLVLIYAVMSMIIDIRTNSVVDQSLPEKTGPHYSYVTEENRSMIIFDEKLAKETRQVKADAVYSPISLAKSKTIHITDDFHETAHNKVNNDDLSRNYYEKKYFDKYIKIMNINTYNTSSNLYLYGEYDFERNLKSDSYRTNTIRNHTSMINPDHSGKIDWDMLRKQRESSRHKKTPGSHSYTSKDGGGNSTDGSWESPVSNEIEENDPNTDVNESDE